MVFRDAIVAVGLVLGVVGLAGCKLVKNAPDGDGPDEMVSSEPGGDMNALVADIWDDKVMVHMRQNATDMATLAPALADDADAAGERYGYRPSSEGSPWNFATAVEGTIVAAKTDTRAATIDVDVNGDGTADAVVQLGPVIRGTALRDVLPFIDFTSFTDQIAFARLSRALNTRAYESALEDVPREDLVGRQVRALGAFTWRGPDDAILVTPVEFALGSQ